MIKLLSTIVLIIMIVLFPPTVLAFISQNAIPGDRTYPIKRGLEDVIIKIASVNPKTAAFFSLDVSNRRFDEAKALIAEGKDANTTLNELVTQTEISASQVSAVSSSDPQTQLKQDLDKNVSNYIVTLAAVQDSAQPTTAPTQNNSNSYSTPYTTATPQPTVIPTSAPTSQPSIHPSTAPIYTPKPTPTAQPSTSPTPTLAPAPMPSFRPSPTPQPSTDPKEICKNLPSDTTSLNNTLKKLCGILDSQTPQSVQLNQQNHQDQSGDQNSQSDHRNTTQPPINSDQTVRFGNNDNNHH